MFVLDLDLGNQASGRPFDALAQGRHKGFAVETGRDRWQHLDDNAAGPLDELLNVT